MFGTMKTLIPQPAICNFMATALWAIVNPPCKEQQPDGHLKDTHCTPQKCLHVDVFEWVWAWDRNMGMFIHYPAGLVRYTTPRGWNKV
jgi:hypothetical protein